VTNSPCSPVRVPDFALSSLGVVVAGGAVGNTIEQTLQFASE